MSQSVNQLVKNLGKRQIDISSCLPTEKDNEYKLSGIIWDAAQKKQSVEKVFVYTGSADKLREAVAKDTGPWTEATGDD